LTAKRELFLPQEPSHPLASGAGLNAQGGPNVFWFYFLWGELWYSFLGLQSLFGTSGLWYFIHPLHITSFICVVL